MHLFTKVKAIANSLFFYFKCVLFLTVVSNFNFMLLYFVILCEPVLFIIFFGKRDKIKKEIFGTLWLFSGTIFVILVNFLAGMADRLFFG